MPDERPIASGRDADVYAIDEHRVVRRYRNGGDVASEAATMRYLARLAFPVPEVYHAHGADLVLERLTGPTMLEAVFTGRVSPAEAALLLADLHARLHALPPHDGSGTGARVLHMDLHPDNVMLEPRGPVVIDWRNWRHGDPDLDLAMSALIVAQVAVDQQHELVAFARRMLTPFVEAAPPSLVGQLPAAAELRRADPALDDRERTRVGAAAQLVTDAVTAAHPAHRA